MPPYILGLGFGLIFIFSLGPAFFALIQTSVQKGLKKAIFLAIGVSLSDCIYVVAALIGVSSLLERPLFRMWLAIFGTLFMFGYGIYSWFKKPRVYHNEVEEQQKEWSYLKYLVKGFFLNGLNPFIVVFWMGIIGIVTVNYDFGITDQSFFFAGVLTTIFAMDIIKAVIALRFRSAITPRSILILNRSVGVILFLFGLQMVYFLFDNFWIEALGF